MRREPIRVHLSCDYAVDFPIEMYVDGHLGYVAPSRLRLSVTLVRDLRDLQQQWEHLPDPDLDEGEGATDADEAAWDSWGQRRELLLERLRTELGPEYSVLVT